METQIKSAIITKKGYRIVNLFGYSTNGIPGLEIFLPAPHAKSMKEKFIFISKKRNLKLPMKRYVLCAEIPLEKTIEDLSWLELPLMLLYWHLGGVLSVMNLADCFCVGRVNSLGQITHLNLPENFYQVLAKSFLLEDKRNFCLIVDGISIDSESINLLPTSQLLSNIHDLKTTDNVIIKNGQEHMEKFQEMR
jgi:hypothetical protein